MLSLVQHTMRYKTQVLGSEVMEIGADIHN